jgi:hypothetical protein
LSGLKQSKSKRKRQPGVYIDDRRELYRSALTVAGKKRFRDFCFMLKLHHHFEEAEPFVGKADSYFLDLIERFDKCPSCFRGCCSNKACEMSKIRFVHVREGMNEDIGAVSSWVRVKSL